MLFLSDVLQIKNKRLYIEHLCDVVIFFIFNGRISALLHFNKS